MKFTKNTLIKLTSAIALLGALAFTSKDTNLKTIAITQIVEHPALDSTYNGIIDELAAAGYVPGKNFNLVFESAQGDPINAAQIAQKFAGLKPAVIVAIGTASAQAMKKITESSNIPVVFSSVTDPLGSRLVGNLKNPESNLTGQSNWVDVTPQLQKFQKLMPSLKSIGVVYNPGETNSVSMFQSIKEKAYQLGIKVTPALATNSSEVPQATQRIVNNVDAIFVSNDNTALSAFESIVAIANKNNTPVFVSDTDMVDRGATAALGPNQYELGRQTGKMVVQLLGGTKTTSLSVGFPQKTEFVLNMNAIAAIRLAVPDRIIKEADFLIPAQG